MTEKVNRINSPLTIIAIFAALAEVNATIAIGLIDDNLHYIFIWFVIGFPTLLVLLFFITLNYNTKVMYSPSDFREDKNFIDSLYGQRTDKNLLEESFEDNSQSIEEIETKLIKSINEKIEQVSEGNLTKEDLTSLLESQKSEIRNVTNDFSNEIIYPHALRKEFAKWVSFPAYLPILYAIIKENAKSISALRKVENKYNLSGRWYIGGINGLKSIIDKNEDKISIKEELIEPLTKWIEMNESTILEIIDVFGLKNDPDNEDDNSSKSIQAKSRYKTQKLQF
ncbi:hypothetical protein [Leeuwenhoekiella sp. MAR_2009_132]|uniref:hypothetical protein n=1 Tax=Leeuwenhoekiella sp. MAR_2009_132 TaxID=1392489 RepID=UPI0006896763|nr:hypothetical protein [Leeuwenhoekiella sp. MAR_2009_132]